MVGRRRRDPHHCPPRRAYACAADQGFHRAEFVWGAFLYIVLNILYAVLAPRATLGLPDREKAHINPAAATDGALHSGRPLLEHRAAATRAADGRDELRVGFVDRHRMAEIRGNNRHGAHTL